MGARSVSFMVDKIALCGVAVARMARVGEEMQLLQILREVSCAVPAGGRLAIIEPSGAGKSSLLRLLNRLDDPTGGEILIREAAGWISPSTAEGFSYAFRSAQALATALEPGLEFAAPRYATATQPLRQAIKAEILKCTPMFTPWLRGIALRVQGCREVVKARADVCATTGRDVPTFYPEKAKSAGVHYINSQL